MKSFVKAVAVLTLAIAVLSTTAFAAVTGGSVVDNQDGTYTATVSGIAANEQTTLLVVDEDAVTGSGDSAVLSTIADSSIRHIDQNATGVFSNFKLRSGAEGKSIYFFAGSATSSAATLIGKVMGYSLEITADSDGATLAGAPISISSAYTGIDSIVWSVDPVDGATISDDSIKGSDLTSTVAGTYIVKAEGKVGSDVVVTDTVEITVLPQSYQVKKTPVDQTEDVETTVAGEEGTLAKSEGGYGFKFEFVPEVAYDKIIWAFKDSEGIKHYSKPVEIAGTSGATTLYFAYGNGSAQRDLAAVEVVAVDAIIHGENGYTYFTDYADMDAVK